MRVPGPAEEVLPQVSGVVRQGVQAGDAVAQPAREEIDGRVLRGRRA